MATTNLKTRLPRSLARKGRSQIHPYAAVAAATVAALVISVFVNRRLAKKAENNNPPAGQFLNVNGVHLHYVERGSGSPLVLLHGNGSMI